MYYILDLSVSWSWCFTCSSSCHLLYQPEVSSKGLIQSRSRFLQEYDVVSVSLHHSTSYIISDRSTLMILILEFKYSSPDLHFLISFYRMVSTLALNICSINIYQGCYWVAFPYEILGLKRVGKRNLLLINIKTVHVTSAYQCTSPQNWGCLFLEISLPGEKGNDKFNGSPVLPSCLTNPITFPSFSRSHSVPFPSFSNHFVVMMCQLSWGSVLEVWRAQLSLFVCRGDSRWSWLPSRSRSCNNLILRKRKLSHGNRVTHPSSHSDQPS